MVEKKSKIEVITLHVVPDNVRKSWFDVAFIQAGVYICVPCLLLGGLLVQGMSLTNAIIAGTVGYIISSGITAIIGIIGEDLGAPSCVVTMSSLGKNGARIFASTLFAITSIGWFMIQNGVCGAAFSVMLQSIGIDFPRAASVLIWGTVMLLTAVYGIDGLKWLNRIAVPTLFITMVVGSFLAVNKYGITALSADAGQTMSLLSGVVLTVSFLSQGMTIASDFTRYQKSRGGVVASSYLGIMIPGIIMLAIGALLTSLAGQNDLTIVLADIGFPILGMIILILATWTTNTTNAYSAGINFVMLFKLKDDKRAMMTIISGAIGTVLAALGFDSYFEAYITWLGILFMPVSGVMIADYWIYRKGNAGKWSYVKGFNWSGIIAWIAGSIATLYIHVGWALFLGFFVSIVVYVVLKKVLPKTEESVDLVDLNGDINEQ